jgi:arylsulfatase A-like enzyme
MILVNRNIWLVSLGVLLMLATTGTTRATPPNVIFFLVDDLGWADLGCSGSNFYETPNIDAFAASGMRFTQGYATCPVCSPTRASILTGRHPVRVGITDWIPGMADAKRPADAAFRQVVDRDNLALEEVTLAEHLKAKAGYQTWFLGKWHLGGEGFWPTDQGFDVNIGGCDRGSPPGGYYAPWKNPNLTAKEQGEYLTTRLTDEAVGLIGTAANSAKPFLLYLSYYNVHTPITADTRTIDHFQAKAAEQFREAAEPVAEHSARSRSRQDNPDYASMVRAVDLSVGRVLEAVVRAGQVDNTVVVFFSDNGGLCTLPTRVGPTCNLPLRSGKGWLYEGGIREPLIIRAPGVTRPGTVCDTPVVSTDFFPTLLELAGLPPAAKLHSDGRSLVPLLRGEPLAARPLFWHYPHYHGSGWRPGAAIRDGRWKLIEFYDPPATEVYDLKTDPGEQHDLAVAEPAVRDRLSLQLRTWQEAMAAPLPVR